MKRKPYSFSLSLFLVVLAIFAASCGAKETPPSSIKKSSEPKTETTQTQTENISEKPYLLIDSEDDWKSQSKKIQVILHSKGRGPEVEDGDFSTIDFQGFLWTDGQRGDLVESSLESQPLDFTVGATEVLPGLEIALIGQTVGTQMTVIVPSNLAYGKEGDGENIPPDTDLIYDIEILDTGPHYYLIDSEKDWNPDYADKLQIVLKKEGKGKSVQEEDRIKVHYRGQIWENGKRGLEFDSSYKRNRPASFPIGVGRVIRGWDISLVGQKVGTELTVIIPAYLAYGEREKGSIPANSDLVFDIEILGTQSSE
jgi:FKBP-type peptidyl-prolyl cis-trans isomerase